MERDLRSGEWDRRHGHLRELEEFDVGLRLVVSTRPEPWAALRACVCSSA
jgi:hypothetical protein